VLKKEACKTVQGSMVLMRGARNGTLYKLLVSTISNGCNSSIVPNGEEEKTLMVYGDKTMFWNQRLGHLREKVFKHYMVKV
jgi:hypothetical protein